MHLGGIFVIRWRLAMGFREGFRCILGRLLIGFNHPFVLVIFGFIALPVGAGLCSGFVARFRICRLLNLILENRMNWNLLILNLAMISFKELTCHHVLSTKSTLLISYFMFLFLNDLIRFILLSHAYVFEEL